MTRVLIVSHYYPPHVGGIEIVARAEAEGLAQRGHEVTVLTSDGARPHGSTFAGGVRVVRARAWHGLEDHGVPFPVFGPGLLGHAWRAVGRADHVHLHDLLYLTTWVVALICRIRRTPYALTQHVAAVHHDSLLVRAVQRAVHATVGRWVLRRADRVYAINPHVRDFVVECGAAPDRTEVLPNGVDLVRFRPVTPEERGEIRARLGLPSEEPLVLFVGRFVPKKGFDVVAGAASDRYHLVFVGGDRPDGLSGARCHFLGELEQEALAEVVRASDVYVGASVGEALTLTALEAMASGLPVVLQSDPAYDDVTLDRRAAVVEDLRTGTLRPLLEELVGDPGRLAALGGSARRWVAHRYSWDRHLDTFEAGLPAPPARPLRVAVVAPHYPPALGGVERYAQRTVEALRDTDGYEPVVIASGTGRRTRVETQDGVTVVRLGTWTRLSNTPVNPLWWWQVPRWLDRLEVDVVNAHSPVPFLADVTAYRAGGRPVLLTYHSGSLVKGDGGAVDVVLRLYERFVMPRVFRRVSANIAVSPTASNHRYGAELIPGGVDVDRFRPVEAPASPRVVYVGRLETTSRWKGVQVLLDSWPEVLRSHPAAVLDVVGDGDDVPFLVAQAERLGIADAVRFRGALHGDDLVAAFGAATVVAVPSLTESECWPLTVMEAMASGRPVVGSRVGGIPHMIRSGVDGWLAEPGDAADLAAALTRALADPARTATMGREARKAAESLSWERQTEQIIAAIGRAAGGR